MKAPEYSRVRTLVEIVLRGPRPIVLPPGTYATIVDAQAQPEEHYVAEWFNPDPNRARLYELLDLAPDDFEVVEDGAGGEAERAWWHNHVGKTE